MPAFAFTRPETVSDFMQLEARLLPNGLLGACIQRKLYKLDWPAEIFRLSCWQTYMQVRMRLLRRSKQIRIVARRVRQPARRT